MTKPLFPMTRACLTVLITCLLISACSKDRAFFDCVKREDANITKVSGPTQIDMSEKAVYYIDFGVRNGCGQFNKFKESRDGNTYEIIVSAIYEGCTCSQDAPIRTATFSFDPPKVGTYFLRFRQKESEWTTKKLEVQ